ncbi:hypothetical protein BDW74DRAFT_176626 [Aspergillus multicolor]|uniref:uncharacterized protein n=1 Tax=Aspergillus multicolor TaxID=41759 RepID=UPI003CCDAAC3
MPFRARLKRAFGRSDKAEDPPKPATPAASVPSSLLPEPDVLSETPTEPPANSPLSTPSTPVNVPSSPARQVAQDNEDEGYEQQTLALQDLWSEAYAQLEQEEPDLIATYEANLINSQQTEPKSVADDATERQTSLQTLVQRRLDDIENSRLTISVGKRKIAVKDEAKRIVQAILSAKEMISFAVSMEPHASLAWAGVLVFLNPVANAFTQDDDAAEGFEYISHLMIRFRVIESTHIEITSRNTAGSQPLNDLGAGLRARIVKLYAQVLRYQMRLAKHYAHSTFFRSMRDLAVADNWKELLASITDMEKGISGDLEILTGHTIKAIDSKVDELKHLMDESLRVATETKDQVKSSKEDQLLNKLPFAAGATFGSREGEHESLCLQGTQMDTLTKIRNWCEDPEGKPILWLHGMAGTGKSTISRTVAAACYDDPPSDALDFRLPEAFCLAASFFFDLNRPDRNNASKLFATMGKTLGDLFPDVKVNICEAIASNPNIGNEALSRQWKHLVLKPLLAWERQQNLMQVALIFVLDALDECKDQRDLRLIFHLMSQVREFKALRVRVLITSRPEAHIRLEMRQSLGDLIQEEVLEKVSTTTTGENDITRYIEHELAKIRRTKDGAEDWPTPQNVKILVEKTGGLFVYASTACRFLAGAPSRQHLDSRLSMIFASRIAKTSPQAGLDQIYIKILESSIGGDDILEEEKQELTELFRMSVGSIITLFEPLGVAALTRLLGAPQNRVEGTLQGLHSLLSVPEDDVTPVTLLHLSFRDFLLDGKRCADESFLVEEAKQHEVLLHRCLQVMLSGLRQNICSLPYPGVLASDVGPVLVAECIPVHLRYACIYWVGHLRASGVQITDGGEVHEFLKTRFVFWLEAMALLGESGVGVRKVRELWDYVNGSKHARNPQVRDLIYDATRFSLNFRTVISTAPLQTYSSALIFAPERSVIRCLFAELIPKWVRQLPAVEARWDSLLQILQGDSTDSPTMSFSPDGRLLAFGAWGRVKVWDTFTGEIVHVLACSGRVYCLEFSLNGRMLAVGSQARNPSLIIWDVDSGEVIHDFIDPTLYNGSVIGKTPICGFIAIAWSADSSILTTVSLRGELEMWDTKTGTSLGYKCLTLDIHQVKALSSSGKLVAWTRRESLNISRLNEDGYQVERAFDLSDTAVDFSQDMKLVALKTVDGFGIFDVETGHVHCLLDVWVGFDDTVMFPSPWGDRDLYGSEIKDDTKFTCVSFSPDGQLVAAVRLSKWEFIDDKFRVWDVTTGALLHDFNVEFALKRISEVKFTADGCRVFGKVDGIGVQVWDVVTGTCVQRISHHGISLVLNSPDGKYFASTFDDDTIGIWDATTAPSVVPSVGDEDKANSAEIRSAVHCQQRDIVATQFVDGSVEVRDMTTCNLISQFNAKWDIIWDDVEFSPDGFYLMTKRNRHLKTGLRVWEVDSGNLIHGSGEDLGPGRNWQLRQFLPDGRLCLAGGNPQPDESRSPGGAIQILNLATGHREDFSTGDFSLVDTWNMALSSDCALLAMAFGDKSIVLWDIMNKAQLHRLMPLRGQSSSFHLLTFSPNNKLLLAAYEDAVALWDVRSGQLQNVMPTYSLSLDRAAFSPDGSLMAGSLRMNEVLLWDATTGRITGRYNGEQVYGTLSFNDRDGLETQKGQLDLAWFREIMPWEKDEEVRNQRPLSWWLSPESECPDSGSDEDEESEMDYGYGDGDQESNEEGYAESDADGPDESLRNDEGSARANQQQYDGGYREGYEDEENGNGQSSAESSQQQYEQSTHDYHEGHEDDYENDYQGFPHGDDDDMDNWNSREETHTDGKGYEQHYPESPRSISDQSYLDKPDNLQASRSPSRSRSRSPSLINEAPNTDRDGINADQASIYSSTSVIPEEKPLPPGNPRNMLISDSWVMQGTRRVLLLPLSHQAAHVVVHDGLFTIIEPSGHLFSFALDPVDGLG